MEIKHDILKIIREFLIKKDYLKSDHNSLEDIQLDFTFLEQSILKDFSNFEANISQLLVNYINFPQDKYKKLMLEELDNIINIRDIVHKSFSIAIE